MAYSFNGTTATVCGVAFPRVLNVTNGVTGAQIDTTGAEDIEHFFEAGLSNRELTIEGVGGAELAIGTSGATTITFPDIGAVALGTTIVVDCRRTGSLDDKITRSVTIKRAR